MSQLTAICNALDFVEAHLTEEIAVADMADAACYSLYHFSRTFNRVVHLTPYDYLMRRRLSESARALLQSDKKIIEVALDYRFNNPETYSRAFKRMFGVQPSQWRDQAWLDERLLLSRLTRAYLEHVNQGDGLRPVLKELAPLRLVGVMTLVGEDRAIVPRLWQVLTRELQGVEGAGYYGLTWYPERWGAHGRLYMAAVEALAGDRAGSALVVKRLPALRCARFIHQGARQDARLTRNYVYQTWLPKSGERLAYPLEVECYGREVPLGGDEAEWEIYIPIV